MRPTTRTKIALALSIAMISVVVLVIDASRERSDGLESPPPFTSKPAGHESPASGPDAPPVDEHEPEICLDDHHPPGGNEDRRPPDAASVAQEGEPAARERLRSALPEVRMNAVRDLESELDSEADPASQRELRSLVLRIAREDPSPLVRSTAYFTLLYGRGWHLHPGEVLESLASERDGELVAHLLRQLRTSLLQPRFRHSLLGRDVADRSERTQHLLEFTDAAISAAQSSLDVPKEEPQRSSIAATIRILEQSKTAVTKLDD